ncbi:gene transfer agent family protein [Roseibium litorale]|uniref:Gene transfer agent family protein n=1 Tax=Roseibium litorale TaxID=2803841 RepID=A0ABR9CRM4_9HYPH|nr:gene transfer agent family protein [Roseibium litorale]MBD8893494.1 gene transfer agent family protein [Roseibium litorale]
MPNRLRGEIAACLDGRQWTLVLTLGALAELEAAFALDSLTALAERFSSGRVSARDLIRVIGAGLRGAGNSVSDDQVAAMTTAGGALGFAAIATDLLQVTFGTDDEESAEDPGADCPFA